MVNDITFMYLYSNNFKKSLMKDVIYTSSTGTLNGIPIFVLLFSKIRNPSAVLDWCEYAWGSI